MPSYLKLTTRFLLVVVMCLSFFMLGWMLPPPEFHRVSPIPATANSAIQNVEQEVGVIALNGSRLMVNRGTDDGIQKDDRIALFRDGMKVGSAKVVHANPNVAIAELDGDKLPSKDLTAYKVREK